METRIRRSILFTPADDEYRMQKAVNTDADAVMYELEDGVGSSDKEFACQNIRDVVPDLDIGEKELCVRINGVQSDRWLEDLRAALDVGVDTVVIPKVDYPWHLRTVIETATQLSEDVPEFIPVVERAHGHQLIDDIVDVCADTPRVTGMWGAFEFSDTLGGSAKSDVMRNHIHASFIKYAIIGDVTPLAAPDPELEDTAAQRAYAERCRDLGYSGQPAIHPKQIPLINDVYTPTTEQYDAAKSYLSEFRTADRSAITAADGTFLDRAIVEKYEKTVERYEAIHGAS